MKSKDNKSNQQEMPFLDHLEELRWRILKSLGSIFLFMFIAFPFSGHILNFLTLPNDHLKKPAKLIFLKPTGMLMVRMEIAIAVGILVSLPVILYQLWKFVSPGLFPKEKRFILPTIFLTTFCFMVGAAFAYMILIPMVLPFLFSMGTESIDANININEYMNFVLQLILIAGLIFELPILSFFLTKIGLITPVFLKRYRSYTIVLIFIFAAIVTPPDPLSQILMAIPLIILYEISIWVSTIRFRTMKKENEDNK